MDLHSKTYLKIKHYSKSLVDLDIEDPAEISALGPDRMLEYAIVKLLAYISANMGIKDQALALEEATKWLNADIRLTTNIFTTGIYSLDEFKLRLIEPVNLFAKDILKMANPTPVQIESMLDLLSKAKNYEETIYGFTRILNLNFDDNIEYIRLSLFKQHRLVSTTSPDLGQSIFNGVVLTALFAKKLIYYKTFL